MNGRIFSSSTGLGNVTFGLFGRAGTQAITNGANSVTVTFSSDLGSTNYSVVCSILNTTDAGPIFLEVVETTKTSGGFVATFNANADSANYVLQYIAVINA